MDVCIDSRSSLLSVLGPGISIYPYIDRGGGVLTQMLVPRQSEKWRTPDRFGSSVRMRGSGANLRGKVGSPELT